VPPQPGDHSLHRAAIFGFASLDSSTRDKLARFRSLPVETMEQVDRATAPTSSTIAN
jgi:hypothetical protein